MASGLCLLNHTQLSARTTLLPASSFPKDGTQTVDAMLMDKPGIMRSAQDKVSKSVKARIPGLNFDAGMPSRYGFTAVFSRTRNTLFVLGGQNALGTPVHSVWAATPYGAHELSTGDELGTVLAATYHHADDTLYIVDEMKPGEARLWMMPALGGHLRLVGSWPRLLGADRIWLVSDRDGSLLVVGTTSILKGGTVIARLDSSNHELVGIEPVADGVGASPKAWPRRLHLRPLGASKSRLPANE